MSNISYNTNGGEAKFPLDTPGVAVNVAAGTLVEQIAEIVAAAAAHNGVVLDGTIDGSSVFSIAGQDWNAGQRLIVTTAGASGDITV